MFTAYYIYTVEKIAGWDQCRDQSIAITKGSAHYVSQSELRISV